MRKYGSQNERLADNSVFRIPYSLFRNSLRLKNLFAERWSLDEAVGSRVTAFENRTARRHDTPDVPLGNFRCEF
ncbi:MAG: hypothetical protein FD138_4131 [Planctomycetota bacterium]|nr:MAG: hypothetical protein FD138_4131 [Planctomycetota bacterium]